MATDYKELTREKLENVEHPESREELRQYRDTKRAQGAKWSTINEHVRAVKRLAEKHPGTSLLDLSRRDITAHVADLVDNYAPATVSREKVALKDFYKHRHPDGDADIGEYPRIVKGMSTAPPKNGGNELTKSDLLTRKQVRAMIEKCESSKEKAAIAVLYESGARAAEFLSLNAGDVERVQHGVNITFNPDGGALKTGSRTVLLIDAAPYLERWLKDHPEGDEPEAPVWRSRQTKGRLTHQGLTGLVERARKRAIPEKELRPKLHIFRHSRATEMTEKGYSEAQLRQYFGWEDGSPMPGRYQHLAGHEVHDARLKKRGLVDEDEEGEDALEPWTCARGHTTEATAKFCGECGLPKNRETLEELETAEEKASEDAVTLEALMNEVQRLRKEVENQD